MQPKKMSLLESASNVIIGLLVSMLMIRYMFPLFGVHLKLFDNITISIIFLIVSFLRSYLIRRLFNDRPQ